MKNKRIPSAISIATPIIASNLDFAFDENAHFMNGQIGKLQSTGIALPHTSGQDIVSIRKSSQSMRCFSAIENHISGIMQRRLEPSSTRTFSIDASERSIAHRKQSPGKRIE